MEKDGAAGAPERPNTKEKAAVGYYLLLLENIFSKEGSWKEKKCIFAPQKIKDKKL